MQHQQKISSKLAALLLSIQVATLAGKVHAAEPVVQPAVDGIIGAFEKHPLVGLGELHMLANELTFYATLVRDPRFASTVGNVVVEFGASQHQDILNRYLNGEKVAYSEIAKVWRNTVNHTPTLMGVGYQTFFAQVRAVNRSLPPEKRIQVWLSEPPVDWSAIKVQDDWQKIFDQRSRHVAEVIEREILNRGKKALVIYGTGHFFSSPWPSTWPTPSGGTETMGEILERKHPGSFFMITPYGGYKNPECSAALEAKMNWPKQVLISPIRGTPLQETLMRPECMSKIEGISPPIPADELARLAKRFYEIDTGVAANALLYIAPAAELMMTPDDPTIWMDTEYYQELSRRLQIRFGQPMAPLSVTLPTYGLPPQPWKRP